MADKKPRSLVQLFKYLWNAKRHGPKTKEGLCKESCHIAWDIDSNGDTTAAIGWTSTKHRFRGIWVPGASVWWTGGSHGDGHEAILARRYGYVWSKDIRRDGWWDRVPIAEIHREWPELIFAGLSLDTEGVVVTKFPKRPRAFDFRAVLG